MSARIESVAYSHLAALTFDEIIDVRSPSEYAEDHLSQAVNLPVLSDEERAAVGTLYQASHFEARKLGAAFASANIARHLQTHLAGKSVSYRPLVYCWRGGQRSLSLATVLSEIGWKTSLIQGGYKAYRSHVLDLLATRPAALQFSIINGLTGSGKTRVLQALENLGGQVLNLEELARHKGSVFGSELGCPQPAQKRFESLLFDRLSAFEPSAPVFVEAESPKIGKLNIPRALWKRMRESPVLEVSATLADRVAFLESDYQEWKANPERILATLGSLRPFHGQERVAQWHLWCEQGNWSTLITSLLVDHYDRGYNLSCANYFQPPARGYKLPDLRDASVTGCAAAILEDARSGSFRGA